MKECGHVVAQASQNGTLERKHSVQSVKNGLMRTLGEFMADNLAAKNRERAAARLLDSIKIRCKKCKGVMVRVYDIWDESYVGYSCKTCPHYYLFTQ